MNPPLSQDELLERIQLAIASRNLSQVQELSPRINWMHQYRCDWLAFEKNSETFQQHSLLQHFEAFAEESTGPNRLTGNKQWKAFCAQAMDVMVANGYRVLDDTYYSDLITQQVDMMPIIAKACHEHDMRGDCGEAPLHKSARQIPFLEGVKASFHPSADINAADDDGQTAFHIMWLENDVSQGGYGGDAWAKTAQWLLAQGADPYRPDIDGQTGMELMAQFIERSDDLRRLRPLTAIFAKLQSELDARALDAATPASQATRSRATL